MYTTQLTQRDEYGLHASLPTTLLKASPAGIRPKSLVTRVHAAPQEAPEPKLAGTEPSRKAFVFYSISHHGLRLCAGNHLLEKSSYQAQMILVLAYWDSRNSYLNGIDAAGRYQIICAKDL